MRVMVVDDEPFMCHLLVKQLARLDYKEVLAHYSAKDALQLLKEPLQDIDLVFCDLQMPGMDGIEFVRQLVHLGYLGGLVLVSGEDSRIIATAENLAKHHRLKVLGGMQKPVSQLALKAIMEQALVHQAQLQQSTTASSVVPSRHSYDAAALHQALNAGELINYYQPKVSLQDGQLLGVETLVRWQHPYDGLVLPDQFILVAEEAGLIDQLTQQVLRAALLQVRRWNDEGMALQVAVNISMDNLASLDFPDRVESLLHEIGVPASALMLEVTESRVMRDPLASLDILTRLRIKKISLSIDDFGTGHSSLRQLHDIPFNELKIDGSFVRGASHDSYARAILQASLNLAQQLGLKTVAEGVELTEDWRFLRDAGCDVAQGWLIARAMPAEQVADWAKEWQERCVELNAIGQQAGEE